MGSRGGIIKGLNRFKRGHIGVVAKQLENLMENQTETKFTRGSIRIAMPAHQQQNPHPPDDEHSPVI